MKHVKTSVAIIVMMTLAAAALTARIPNKIPLAEYGAASGSDNQTEDPNPVSWQRMFETGYALATGASDKSRGVHLRFEAEYDTDAVVNCGDSEHTQYFYKSVGRVGHYICSLPYSHQFVWCVPAHTAGYAYRDLYPRREVGSLRAGRDGRLKLGLHLQKAVGSDSDYVTEEGNRLLVAFAFKVMDVEALADDDTLATFSFTTYADAGVGERVEPVLEVTGEPGMKYVKFKYGTETGVLTSKSLTKVEYLKLPYGAGSGDPTLRMIVFEFPLETRETDAAGLSLADQGVVNAYDGHWLLDYLNPRMWWHGRGGLLLDYVEYHDLVYQEYAGGRSRAGMPVEGAIHKTPDDPGDPEGTGQALSKAKL